MAKTRERKKIKKAKEVKVEKQVIIMGQRG